MTYGIVSFVWLRFYKNQVRFHMKTLCGNFYSTKPKKCLNLYSGHRSSSSGYGFFIIKLTYPEKATMSTIFNYSLATLLEKTLKIQLVHSVDQMVRAR